MIKYSLILCCEKGYILGLKENIDALKQEISTEEQFLESIIKGERFFKKYKKVIISSVAVLFIGLGVYGGVSFVNERKIEASNEAYKVLISNPKDEQALNMLKDNNERLHKLFLFSQAIKNGDKVVLSELSSFKEDPILSDLSAYQLSGLEAKDEVKSELLRGLALLQAGYKLLLEDKINEAKLQFAQIDVSSPLKNIANSLEHYQGK